MSRKRTLVPGVPLALSLLLGACAREAPAFTPQGDAGQPQLLAEALSPLPAGGSDVLGPDTFMAFDRASGEGLRVEPFAVQNRSFTKAWRFTTSGALESPTSHQLQAANTLLIEKDDVLVLQFRARSTGTAPARTEFVFEENVGAYDKSVSVGANLSSQWTLYSMPFKSARAYAPGEGYACFRLGFPNQSFEMGGIVIRNYGKTQTVASLPFGGFSYPGRESTAPWRSAANARIEQLRKADVAVRVQTTSGLPIAGASVKLEMRRHAFPFGTAVSAAQLFEDSADGRKYQQMIPTLFSGVVLENDLKWPWWESETRPQTLQALKFFRDRGIPVRGHTLLWGCAEDECFPADVPALFANPAALRARIDGHLVDILGATRGQILEWDVINEPSAGKRFIQALGEDELAAQLRRAKQLDPAARMMINDNANLGEGNQDAEFRRILRRMQALGAPLEGIGLQGHMGNHLTPPEELQGRLNGFGELGVPISITEFDSVQLSETLQADYLRDFMTIAFSNQHVSSFMHWGFWEGAHWIPEAALYRKDWSIKPNGQAYKDLVFGKWWTKVNGRSDTGGVYRTRGFLGDYTLTVTANGKTTSQIISLKKGMGTVVVRR